MSNELMDSDEDAISCKDDGSDDVMEDLGTVAPTTEKKNIDENESTFSVKNGKENEQTDNSKQNFSSDDTNNLSFCHPLSPAVTNTSVFHSQNNTSAERGKSVWTVKSPVMVKPCSTTFTIRRKSQENYPAKHFEDRALPNKGDSTLNRGLGLIGNGSPSAFTRKPIAGQLLPTFMDIDIDGSILKRCNSAPILNDPDGNTFEWSRPIASTAGRTRRFSANVVSLNSSPAATTPRSRLRLYQIKKEESLEGIQSKETEHEREVQTTLQISSNCGDLSLADRRSSYDSSSSSPRSNQSPSSFPHRSHFPTPPSSLTGGKSNYSRAIDFNTPVAGPLTPASHHPSSGGIPSPLTISASPAALNLSPLPPSPTRTICGPGKQCFSPSMHIPVCLARNASRSPSPSPTRRTFVTRRRSQSPCIMRPSALGPIKRKYDSDSEGSSSPKRMYTPSTFPSMLSGSGGGEPMATAISASHRVLVHRSHSLSSSSVDSSDMYVSPSPPHHVTTFVTTHHHGNHQVTSFTHPLQYSSSPLSSVATSQSNTVSPTTRSTSPTNSTCSSSSLEGLRDLQPLTSGQRPFVASKKS